MTDEPHKITPIISMDGASSEQRIAAIHAEQRTGLRARFIAPPEDSRMNRGDVFRCQLGKLDTTPWSVTVRSQHGTETFKGTAPIFHLKGYGSTFEDAARVALA
jgi:hypothetical protein